MNDALTDQARAIRETRERLREQLLEEAAGVRRRQDENKLEAQQLRRERDRVIAAMADVDVPYKRIGRIFALTGVRCYQIAQAAGTARIRRRAGKDG